MNADERSDVQREAPSQAEGGTGAAWSPNDTGATAEHPAQRAQPAPSSGAWRRPPPGKEPKTQPGAQPTTLEEAKEIHANVARLGELAASDPVVNRRLQLADTLLQVHCADHEGLVLTYAFDRDPIEVTDGAAGDPEVIIWATARQTWDFWVGEMHLAMIIAHGYATYEGPVRKILKIVPIARRMVESFREMSGLDASVKPEVKPTGLG